MLPSFHLLNCRLVNRQWSEISSEIIRQRADIKLAFKYEDGEFLQVIKYRRCEELLIDNCKLFTKIGSKNLSDLVECIADATNFPFSSFQFDDLSKFCSGDARSFLALWGKQIVALSVNIDYRETETGILRKLLFDRVTNLKELEIGFRHRIYPFREGIPISIQRSTYSTQFQLDHLEVFYVGDYHSRNSDIIENIVAASSNLTDLAIGDSTEENGDYSLNNLLVTVPILELLQKLNKLHCLTNVRIELSEVLIDYWLKSKCSMELKLQSFDLWLHPSIWENERLKSFATSIANQLFHSSKDMLHTLQLPNLGEMTALVIPKLTNLRKLILPENYGEVAMFPQFFNLAYTFPNVKELGKLKN